MYKKIVTIVLLGVWGFAIAQSTSSSPKKNSPISSIGLGLPVKAHGAVNGQTNLGISYSSSLFLNTQNPALLNRSSLMVFEYGMKYDGVAIQDNSQTGFSGEMNLHYIGFSLPISRKWTSSLGFTPILEKSYSYKETKNFSDGSSFSINSSGKGTINKFYFGNALQIIKDTTTRTTVDIGLEPSFMFGNIQDEVITKLSTQNYEVGENLSSGVKGWGLKGGLSIRKELFEYPVKTKNGVYSSYSFAKSLDTIITHDIPREGKYMIYFPHKKGLMIDPEITDKKLIKHLRAVFYYEIVKKEGVYLQPNAVNATDGQLLAEYKALKAQSDSFLNTNNQALKNYYKKASGVFVTGGLTYQIQSDLSLLTNKESFVNNTLSTQRRTTDTLFSIKESGILPPTLGVGLTLEKPFPKGYKKDGTRKTAVWSLGTELKMTNWTAANSGYINTYTAAIGGEYVSDISLRNENTQERSGFGRYVRRVIYRGGLSYGTLPYLIGNDEVTRLGIDFGLSLPVGSYRRPKYVNIGFGYTQLGSLDNNNLQERIYTTSFSFTMNEKWFKRWKIGL